MEAKVVVGRRRRGRKTPSHSYGQPSPPLPSYPPSLDDPRRRRREAEFRSGELVGPDDWAAGGREEEEKNRRVWGSQEERNYRGKRQLLFFRPPFVLHEKKPRCVSISEGGAKRIWPGFCTVYVGKWSGRPPACRGQPTDRMRCWQDAHSSLCNFLHGGVESSKKRTRKYFFD